MAGVATGHRGALLIISFVSLIMLAGAAYVLLKRVINPLEEVVSSLERISKGDLRHRIRIEDKNGLGGFAESMNDILRSVDEGMENCKEFIRELPDPVIELDRHGNITFMNGAALKATGYSGDEALNRHYAGMIPETGAIEAENALKKALRGEITTDVELPLSLKGGGVGVFEFTCIPFKKSGKVAGCRLVGRDIDDKKKLIEDLRKAKRDSDENSEMLKRTIRDLEDFALLAVRRELKMHEIRQRLKELKEDVESRKAG